MKIYVQNVIISEWITQYSPSSSWWSKLCAQESPLAGCSFSSTLENQEASRLQTSSYSKLRHIWKCKVGDFLFRLAFFKSFHEICLLFYYWEQTYLTGLLWLFSSCIYSIQFLVFIDDVFSLLKAGFKCNCGRCMGHDVTNTRLQHTHRGYFGNIFVQWEEMELGCPSLHSRQFESGNSWGITKFLPSDSKWTRVGRLLVWSE